jgi:3-oxoacyl-[acyl-carrier-protein] synthase-1
MQPSPRIAPIPVTAYALANALGGTTREVVDSLSQARSGLAPCRLPLPFETWAGELPVELPRLEGSEAPWNSRQARIAARVLEQMAPAADRAVARWGRERVAVVLGTSTGGIGETERAYATFRSEGRLPESFDFERQHAFHALIDLARARTGAAGPGYAISTACSSSGKVLGTARRLINAGVADAVLAGGVDSLCQTTLRGFRSLEVLSSKQCRPFSRERDGLNIGEGGALLLLEREGDAAAALLGVGESSDAHHMSHPHPEGLGALAAMREALAQAGVEPGEIDYINAHGTGTPINDAVEGKAIAEMFGSSVPVVSTKGYTGHMLGAGGATEAAFSVLAIEQGWIPAGVGANPLDPEIALNIPLTKIERRCRKVLSNSFAFGGSNVSVLLGAVR